MLALLVLLALVCLIALRYRRYNQDAVAFFRERMVCAENEEMVELLRRDAASAAAGVEHLKGALPAEVDLVVSGGGFKVCLAVGVVLYPFLWLVGAGSVCIHSDGHSGLCSGGGKGGGIAMVVVGVLSLVGLPLLLNSQAEPEGNDDYHKAANGTYAPPRYVA